MIKRLLWNEIRNHKLLSISTVIFMAISSLFIALSAVLFTDLLGSVNGLMDMAKTPDYLQMHAGEMDVDQVEAFAEEYPGVDCWQVSSFLNLENNTLTLGNSNLAENTQDNGLCMQGEKFDYLLDMNNTCPEVKTGEVYVPVCYRSLYDLQIGDTMQIGKEELTIAGFIRDSQMNSMMASSKRFLVCEADYEQMKTLGEEEYLIEFLLNENTDTDSFAAAYEKAGLFANGPAITKPLIRMMNALSDGIMIFVIFLAGIAVLLISLLCIRFITALAIEQDRKEAGLLKALGIGNKDICFLYFSKYLLFSSAGLGIGFGGAWILKSPLSETLRELYGASNSGLLSAGIAFLACILVQALILFSIRCVLRKLEKMSALDALFSVKTQSKTSGREQYVIIGLVAAVCMIMTLIPQNLHSTMASPEFVTYMGIGDAAIRMDVRQSDQIGKMTEQLTEELRSDPEVLKYTALETVFCDAYPANGERIRLIVETGDHSVFPVKYAEGRQPETGGEIALSSLQAQDLGLEIGDTLVLSYGGQKSSVSVCGIYSDITNGGKTAKMRTLPSAPDMDHEVMWSILYVSLKNGSDTEQWMEQYKRNGVNIVDIAGYVQETYGPTIHQIEMAKRAALGASVIITAVVMLLFMRLLIEKKRYSISLRKALGFCNGSIRRDYFIRGYLPAASGMLAGVLAGVIIGEWICSQLLKSFGAYGFRFVICWPQAGFMVMILMMTAAAAVCLGTLEVKKIKAYECCLRKE